MKLYSVMLYCKLCDQIILLVVLSSNVLVVAFSKRVRIFGECLIHLPPALFFSLFFF